MNTKKYFDLVVLAIYPIGILFLVYEIIQSGVSIKLYQVLLLVGILISFIDRLRTFLKNRKKE